jgi:hypothetical protein
MSHKHKYSYQPTMNIFRWRIPCPNASPTETVWREFVQAGLPAGRHLTFKNIIIYR